jgi:hypothetical protein
VKIPQIHTRAIGIQQHRGTMDVYGHLLRDADQETAIKLRGIVSDGNW